MPEKLLQLSDVYQPNQMLGQSLNMMQLLQQGQRIDLQESQNQIELQRLHKTEVLGGIKQIFEHPDKFSPDALLRAGNAVNQMIGIQADYTPDQIKAAGPLMSSAIDAYEQHGGQSKEFQAAFRAASDALPPLREAIQKRIAATEATRQPAMARTGFGELAARTGVENTPNVQAAIAASGPLQTQLGQQAFDQVKIRDAQLRVSTLTELHTQADVGLKKLMPIRPFLGHMGTPEERQVLAKTNPYAKNFLDQRTALEARSTEVFLEKDHQLTANLNAINDAKAHGRPTEDLERQRYRLDLEKNLVQREMRFYANPTEATYRAWKEENDGIQTYIEESLGTIQDIQAQRLVFDVGKERTKQEETGRLGQAQAEFTAGALTPERAGQIAAKYGVLTEDVLKAGKDPNKAGQITVNLSPGERKDMAEERAQLREITAVENLYSAKFVGIFDNLIAKLKGPANLLNEDEAQFRASVKKMGAGLRKFYAGTAQSKAEMKNLVESIPDTDMAETQFRASLAATKANVERLLQERVAVGQEVGARTPGAKPSRGAADPRMEQLKQSFPGVPDDVIEGFLQGR